MGEKMSSNSNTNFNLEKLLGRENYSTWAYAMENYLEIEDLWGCVNGSVTDETKCRKAKGRIVLNINPRLYDHFRELVSPMEIWEKLKTLFADNGLDRRIGLIRQLPMEASNKISKEMCPKSEEETELMRKIPYREAIGSLQYLATVSRPDIAYAVSFLSQYNCNPGLAHWKAVKTIFRYLKGTMDYKLCFNKSEKFELHGFSDADWAGDYDARKSTSGYLFKMAGGPISWKTQRQAITALSSCEAEYISLSSACQEAMWLLKFNKEFKKQEQIGIEVDNQSAIIIANSQGYSSRTKHIDIRHNFVKDVVSMGNIKIDYVGTNDQLADGLTKPLGPTKIKIAVKRFGLKESN